ncbi:MAG: LCP family protein [Chloroflexota bacterium]
MTLTLFLILLTACEAFPAQVQTPAGTPTALILVTVPPDATPTPTPFQPLLDTEASTPTSLRTSDQVAAPDYAPPPFPILTDNETVTFALLGSDTRGGQSFRTDTIVIAALRPKSGQVTLISIPRDLWVYIPTRGMERVNTAYQYGEIYAYPGGGSVLFKDTLLYNLGIRIDHIAIVNFDGFRQIVDTLGGIDVPIAAAYTDWHSAPYNGNMSLYTVGPGVVHMDGDLSLWYARARKNSSDFDRGRRQQEVLRAIYTRALQVDAIAKIPQLYNDLNAAVTTDLGLTDLLQLAPLAFHLTNADIRSYYIGKSLVTDWMTPGGASVLLPNGPAIQAMLQEALSPSSRPPEMANILIEVRNGTPNSGWDTLAVQRLNYAGYEARTALVDRTDYASSLLYDLTTTQDPNRAASLLAILGLPPSALVSAPMQSEVSYVLIVGADYQPYFNPDNMAP